MHLTRRVVSTVAATGLLLAGLGSPSLMAQASPAGSAPAPAAARGPGSLWAWTYGPKALVELAVEQDVDRVYVYVYQPRGAELRRLQRLAARAELAGIELWALSGDPRWALHHRPALAWQRKALATGLFVGTHLDVEPYALRAWKRDRERVVTRFLDLLATMEAADDRPFATDVPYWYGTIESAGGTLADDVLEVVDAVTVMSYRDTATGPNSLSVVAEDMLARADAAAVPLELAVETNRLDDCGHCTFFEEGAPAMRAVIAEVDMIMDDRPSYTGFAIHDSTGLAALLDRRS